ncbi:MAG: RNA polymerase sigma factor [Planctomycetales bacterium]|nr:RNA polymerase sigma factor [Planctomycetales bacterium]
MLTSDRQPFHERDYRLSSLQSDYERIIRPIERQMMCSVWRITQTAEDADDAFQEAMTQIWQRLPRIRSHPNPQALVLRICTNVACDVLRRKKRRGNREQSLGVPEIDAATPDVAALILSSERREQVKAAIARLPEQQATAVTMRFLLYCPYEEIAQALGCAEATARVHVTRGLSRLRDLLAHLNPSPALENQS